ncbi:ketoacyl-ACP synthase III [Amycolatopsis rubida]|uniref:Ketoacyl-ACP synthase III n=1 Tax=Amycolatopsis rubida TaxID=112413 RepID=A0ABX0C142_9PSEU|nr:ketoacyl-ACP synthase III [Amycolatopsis sp. M39]MYW93791.1 beta-ketoacyl-ACP synthase 3 [Amycolatopsis rubida]NEC58781.1 ketoacyl-ACP synthase III [Amycolatopsis rubida]OAP22980.1 3-oxoacyl-[acyl-carrier-protein] synthase 3 [Amycolatopsis sp. M39]
MHLSLDEPSVGIRSIGAYTPPDVVTNEQIARPAATTAEWIAERTGIFQRRYAARSQSTSAMAEPAARDALEQATGRVGALIVATSTPDQIMPPTATALQRRLGLSPVPAFDINAACGGFLYGMALCCGLVRCLPDATTVLLVGADQYSKYLDSSDRRTAAIFGDGAGAVILGPVPPGYGVRAVSLAAFGDYHDAVGILGCGTREVVTADVATTGRAKMRMNGREVRELFLREVPEATRKTVEAAGWRLDEVDRFVFHQGNVRLLHDIAGVLGIDPGKVGVTADRFGNTGCGSMPLTLYQMNRANPLRSGEKILFAGAGGGMTAGALAATWW